MSLSELSPSLLDRYLTGECSVEEADTVRHWLHQHPTHKMDFDLLREVREVAIRTPVWDAQEALKRAKRAHSEFEGRAVDTTRKNAAHTTAAPLSSWRNPSPSRPSWATAAWHRISPRVLGYTMSATLGVLALFVVGWQISLRRAISLPVAQPSVYTTDRGERAKITLPDGSVVLLNVASRLDVPSNYATGTRTVHLTGEALFTVVNNGRAPFTVVAGPSTTRVLGTSFVVRHYAEDTAATVAVRDGKVDVQSTVLTAAQEISVGQRGTSPVRASNAGQFTFATGVLTLNGMSLAEAVVELNRWYDADIRFGDQTLANRRVKGRFATGSLSDLAEIIEWTFDVRAVRNGKTLTLYTR